MRYPLCDRTVTVYRLENGQVSRFVVEGCFYRHQEHMTEEVSGLRIDRKCLLVIPGEQFLPRVGDRVCEGIGPEEIDWDSLLPVYVPTLTELNYVAPQYWMGAVCHIEAGRN